MYVIREVLNCKPGKVRQMVEKFRSISTVLQEMADYHDLVTSGRREIYRIES
jgi:hypothetical protein